MYESPIKAIHGEIQMQFEDGILKAVQSYGFDVSKEELAKALVYDRGQYDKGYKDGFASAINEFAEKFIFQAVCQGCSGCCNCYELGRQMQCGEYKRYMEIAEQLKRE